MLPTQSQSTEVDTAHGRELFGRACVACHSLQPDRSMTGPSLARIMSRKAGSLASFPRYSSALRTSGIVWDEEKLDAWIKDPKALVPGNRMVFPGIPDDQARKDVIAFLKHGSDGEKESMGGMMDMGGDAPNLKTIAPASQVKGITYCGDTYSVTTGDGQMTQFWERNLRFKTDSGSEGPAKGTPAIVSAGMVGDRSSIIFSAPEEIGQFIRRQC
jgi:cytochrome c